MRYCTLDNHKHLSRVSAIKCLQRQELELEAPDRPTKIKPVMLSHDPPRVVRRDGIDLVIFSEGESTSYK